MSGSMAHPTRNGQNVHMIFWEFIAYKFHFLAEGVPFTSLLLSSVVA
jgi:hypothetical protein